MMPPGETWRDLCAPVSENNLYRKLDFPELRSRKLGEYKGTKGAGTNSSPSPRSGGGGSRTRVRERAVREILRA